MIVDEVDDLHLGRVGKAPVGDIGLPALVEKARLEAHEARTRTLARLRSDETPTDEHAVDSSNRRHQFTGETQVVVDRLRAGVEALLGELFARQHNSILELGWGPVPDPARRPGAWFDRFDAARAVAGDELGDPGLGNPVGGRDLAVTASFELDGFDDVVGQIHRTPPR